MLNFLESKKKTYLKISVKSQNSKLFDKMHDKFSNDQIHCDFERIER